MIYNLSNYTYMGYIVPMEFWKPITDEMVPGVKPIYWVSNIGNVYNAESNKYHQFSDLSKSHYVRVTLKRINEQEKPIAIFVHRLVCMAFNGIPKDVNDLDVDHLNMFKSCNYEGNLEFVTHGENVRRANVVKDKGEDVYRAILTNKEVDSICVMLSRGIPIPEIYETMKKQIYPKECPALRSIIYSILHRESWNSISYKYEFPDYSRDLFSIEEVVQICELLQQRKSYDEIIEIMNIGYDSEIELKSIKNTMSRLKHGHIYKDISSKYNMDRTIPRSLTEEERHYACKSMVEGIPAKKVLDSMERGKVRAVRLAVHDIYRGVCSKDIVNYYKSKLESSTTIPEGSTLK